jgi:ankyrin repeat protein
MKFLETNGFNIYIKDNDGDDAYLLAASSGQLKVMEFLENKGFDIYIKNKDGDDAYLSAVHNGRLEVMNFLENKGFDIYIKNNYGDDAYLLAVSYGYLEIMDLIEAKGINIHIKNNNENNAYLLASLNGYIQIMRVLEEKGINIYLKNMLGQNAYTITNSQDIKTHLLTLGFTIDAKINLKYVYELKTKKFIQIHKDADQECPICKCDIVLNDKFLKCGYNHAIHNSCYTSYCESKNEIKCECLFCLTEFIL